MNMSKNIRSTVITPTPFAAVSRMEKKLAAASGKTADEIREMENVTSHNLAEDFNPTSILRRLMEDDEPDDRPEPQEDGVQLSEGALRVLALAQGDRGLTAGEKERLDRAEHRADLDRALDLAVGNANAISEISGTTTVDDNTAMKGSKLLEEFFNDGRRDFTAAEDEAMQYALDTATRIYTLSDDPEVNERHRRQQIAGLQIVAAAIADGTATREQRIRWSRFNTSKLLNLLKTTRWADLPLDLVRNF
jgi:hypothetical protein